MAELVRTISLAGFDPEGEPVLRVMSDGSLVLFFEYMPPFDMEDREQYFVDHFEKQLGKAVGVPVVWEDREAFRIPTPKSDTLARVQEFIAGYWKAYPEARG